jgi:hypothetical protein
LDVGPDLRHNYEQQETINDDDNNNADVHTNTATKQEQQKHQTTRRPRHGRHCTHPKFGLLGLTRGFFAALVGTVLWGCTDTPPAPYTSS